MIDPPIDDLLRQVNSKYALVVLAAKRARMLAEKETVSPNGKPIKAVSIALKEIASGKLRFETTKSGIK
ncbi:MAG: DNA-directed RNA polymerase subunit omega [Clostridia bacterium]|nr:DNA-directed RNA polymerase subunit omega [Clostridia bacterium]